MSRLVPADLDESSWAAPTWRDELVRSQLQTVPARWAPLRQEVLQ